MEFKFRIPFVVVPGWKSIAFTGALYFYCFLQWTDRSIISQYAGNSRPVHPTTVRINWRKRCAKYKYQITCATVGDGHRFAITIGRWPAPLRIPSCWRVSGGHTGRSVTSIANQRFNEIPKRKLNDCNLLFVRNFPAKNWEKCLQSDISYCSQFTPIRSLFTSLHWEHVSDLDNES